MIDMQIPLKSTLQSLLSAAYVIADVAVPDDMEVLELGLRNANCLTLFHDDFWIIRNAVNCVLLKFV